MRLGKSSELSIEHIAPAASFTRLPRLDATELLPEIKILGLPVGVSLVSDALSLLVILVVLAGHALLQVIQN